MTRSAAVHHAAIVLFVTVVALSYRPAAAQDCRVQVDNCEWQCGIVVDPASEGTGFTTFLKDPACLADCAKLCDIPRPTPCPARDRCQDECPLVPVPSSEPGMTTLIHEPGCVSACGAVC